MKQGQKKWVFFAVAALLSYALPAQDVGFFSGQVLDQATKESLIGAHIRMKTDPSNGTISDDNGFFNLAVPAGRHQMLISYTSMKNDTLTIEVEAGHTIYKVIEMKAFSTQFEEVEIRGGKFDQNIEELTYSLEVIQPRTIDANITRDVTTVLDQTPGVNILDGEPQIRGGSGFTFGVGSKVGIFIDDMPALSGDAGRPYWSLIPVENIDQIDVIKGAASVLSGSASLSGAIYVRTAYPKSKPLTKIQVYTGSFTTPRFREMKWWRGVAYTAGASFLHSKKAGLWDIVLGGRVNFDHSYIGAPVPGEFVVDTISDFTDGQMASQQLRFNFNLNKRSAKIKGLSFGLNGNLMYHHRPMVLAWLDDSVGFYRAYPGAVFLQTQYIGYMDPHIEYFSSAGVKHSLKTRFLYNDNQMTNDQSNRSWILFGEYQLKKEFLEVEQLELILGTSSQYVDSYAIMYGGSGSPNNSMLNISAYGELIKGIGSSIRINAGVRAEYFHLNDTVKAFKPVFRLGANFKLAQETYFRASFGQGYRFPTITERFIRTSVGTFGVFENPQLVPEDSWNAEIGIKQGLKFGNYFGYVDVAGFWQEYANTIEYLFGFWDPTYTFALAGFKFVNTGKSRIIGAEISHNGMAKIGSNGSLTTMFGYAYILPTTLEPDLVYATDARNIDYTYKSTSINPSQDILKYRFLHTIKTDIEYVFKGFAIGTSIRFFSRIENLDQTIEEFENATNNSGGTLQPIFYMDYFNNHNTGHWIVDGRFSYSWLEEKHKVSLVVTNLLNRWYSLRPLKAEPMRQVMIQYTLTL